MKRNIFKLAIDGPSGVGKSSTASHLAKKLNFIQIDSGTLYRAITYIILEMSINIDHDSILENKALIEQIDFKILKSEIIYNNKDIKPFLRESNIEKNVVIIARMPIIRSKIKSMQHKLIDNLYIDGIKGVVIDGRDIGTVIMPDANVKIFLTATKEIRAMRRWAERKYMGSYDQLLNEMVKRDYEDINREHAPLKQADDAIVVDNTYLTVMEQVDIIEKLVLDKMNEEINEKD